MVSPGAASKYGHTKRCTSHVRASADSAMYTVWYDRLRSLEIRSYQTVYIALSALALTCASASELKLWRRRRARRRVRRVRAIRWNLYRGCPKLSLLEAGTPHAP